MFPPIHRLWSPADPPFFPGRSCLLLAFLCAALPIRAAEISWAAPAGGSWFLAENWVGGTPPGSNDLAVITAAGAYSVQLEGDANVAGLILGDRGSEIRLEVFPGRSLALSHGGLVAPAAQLSVFGAITVGAGATLTNQGQVRLDAGTVTGRVANQGTLLVMAPSSVAGRLESLPGSRVVIQASVGRPSSLTLSESLTNAGTIEIGSSFGAVNATLAVTNGLLANAPTATIRVAGEASTHTLAAPLFNQGLIQVEQGLRLQASGAIHENRGTIEVLGRFFECVLAGGGRLDNYGAILGQNGANIYFQDGTIRYFGGQIGGASVPRLRQTTLDLRADFTVTNSFSLDRAVIAGSGTFINGSSATLQLRGDCLVTAPLYNQGVVQSIYTNRISGPFATAPGSTLLVSGLRLVTDHLSLSQAFTNHGTVELRTTLGGPGTILEVEGGGLLNAPDGTLLFSQGFGGSRALLAPLRNEGTLLAQIDASLLTGQTAVTNAGLIQLEGPSSPPVLTLSGPGLINQEGGVITGSGRVAAQAALRRPGRSIAGGHRS